MIVLDMAKRSISTRINDKMFSVDNNILTLQIKVFVETENYDLTGKTITAIFKNTGIETAPLTVIEDIILLPISNDLIESGENIIKLNFRTGKTTFEQSPSMTWYIMEGVGGKITFDSVNIVSHLIATLNNLIDNTSNPGNIQGVSKNASIPKLLLEGNMSVITKDVEDWVDFTYRSDTQAFNGACKIKWQGTSSIAYPKKNYTIKLYDKYKGNKLNVPMFGWGEQNKFCLKANWIDFSQSRNIVSARIWGDMVATRENIQDEISTTPNYGAIDGYPIELYINGKSQGVYTWNIPKDGWMFGMDDNVTTHTILCAETHEGACAFRENALLDGTDWSLEFPDNLYPETLSSFNNVINFVKNTNDATFTTNFSNFLDLEACIDYYIYALFMGHVDGLGKNMLMVTYDGVKWFPSMYDMDSTWGLHFAGIEFVPYTTLFPNEYNCSNSLLWERLKNNFAQQIYDRYLALKNDALSIGNIITKFENFIENIPSKLTDKDKAIWKTIPNAEVDHLEQISEYVVKRYYYADNVLHSYVNKNMFNSKLVDANYYVDSSTGNSVNHGDYYSSIYIPAYEGRNYTLSGTTWGRVVFFDKNENYLQGYEGNAPLTCFAPSDTRLVRISIPKQTLATTMLEEGIQATSYVPYNG